MTDEQALEWCKAMGVSPEDLAKMKAEQALSKSGQAGSNFGGTVFAAPVCSNHLDKIMAATLGTDGSHKLVWNEGYTEGRVPQASQLSAIIPQDPQQGGDWRSHLSGFWLREYVINADTGLKVSEPLYMPHFT